MNTDFGADVFSYDSEESILPKLVTIEENKNYMVDALPLDLDGQVSNIIFINCVFVNKNRGIKFNNCEFRHCRNTKYLNIQ